MPRVSSPLGEGRALEQVLHVLRPLVRLLIQRGVGYGALAAALKRVFLDEARRELQRQGRPETDSALSLLSGLHRHNVRSVAGARRVIVMTEEGPQPACVIATNVYHRTAQGWRMVAHHASPGTLQDIEDAADAPQVLH